MDVWGVADRFLGCLDLQLMKPKTIGSSVLPHKVLAGTGLAPGVPIFKAFSRPPNF
jgi:hypothetical protein